MRVSVRPIIFVLTCCLVAPGALSQQLRYAELGDFRLESGAVIRDCHIGFRTFGTLNEARSNAILFPTWFEGTSAQVGAALPQLGLDQYYVVAIDALGNGVSSSPSNSQRQPRMHFPSFTVRDMVEAEHEVLVRDLRVRHLKAVVGISMGGIQTFQWMVSYPDFMDDAIPMFGAPRLSAYSLLYLKLGMDLIMADAAWKGGDYDAPPALLTSTELSGLSSYTPEYFNVHTDRDQLFQEVDASASAANRSDANDRIRQTQALLKFDISQPFAGSMPAAAAAVRARTLIIVSKSDHLVTPGPALEFAQLARASTLILDDECGHNAIHCEPERVVQAIHDLLDTTGGERVQ